MEKALCLHCKSPKRKYRVQLIPTNKPQLTYFPKYLPQIKESCGECGKFIKFSTQTPEIIKLINDQLKDFEITDYILDTQESLF